MKLIKNLSVLFLFGFTLANVHADENSVNYGPSCVSQAKNQANQLLKNKFSRNYTQTSPSYSEAFSDQKNAVWTLGLNYSKTGAVGYSMTFRRSDCVMLKMDLDQGE